MLPKMRAYRRDFDENKYIYFSIKDNELLEEYNEICVKVIKVIKNGFDSEPACMEKYLKGKIKSSEAKSIRIFVVIKCQEKASLILFLI